MQQNNIENDCLLKILQNGRGKLINDLEGTQTHCQNLVKEPIHLKLRLKTTNESTRAITALPAARVVSQQLSKTLSSPSHYM